MIARSKINIGLSLLLEIVYFSCAVSREGCRILTAVYKMFKTSEPCTKLTLDPCLQGLKRVN